MFYANILIHCLQERPTLWAKNAKDYSNINCKEKPWLEAGEIMYENWLGLE